MSTSTSLGSVWALDGGQVSMGTRGVSSLVGGACTEGEGLDSQSARESGEGAFSMRSAREVVDIVVVRMISGAWVVRFQMALGYLL